MINVAGRRTIGPWTVPIGLLGGLLIASSLLSVQAVADDGDLFIDYVFYRDVGARFLADGTYYLSHQLQGAYDVTLMQDVLYPPTALLLFVPTALTPAPVWWAVPIGLLAYAVYVWRPAPWGIAAMLLLLCWPRAHSALLYGNTDMWVTAAIAAGLLWGWPAVTVLLKPTFTPFAFIGIRHRSWWLALATLAVASLAFLPMWFDYLKAATNLRAPADYTIGSVPLLAVPLVAWFSSVGINRVRASRDHARTSV